MGEFPFVEWLARLYKARGETHECWCDYLKGHALANFCVARDRIEERYNLVYKIEDSWYKGKHPLTYKEQRDLTERHKELLQSYRHNVSEEINSLEEKEKLLSSDDVFNEGNMQLLLDFSFKVFAASEKCSTGYIEVSRKIISTCVQVLTNVGLLVPCEFAVIAFGSVAKGEATPYSDLEYAFIVESENKYFTSLAIDSYFRICNLCESPLEDFDIDELKLNRNLTALLPAGYRTDGMKQKAGNIPTGRIGGQKLILTIDQFMDLYKASAMSGFDGVAGDKSDMYSSSVLIYSSEGKMSSLYEKVKSEIKDFEASLSKSKMFVNKKRLYSFAHDLESYNYIPGQNTTSASEVNVKVKTHIFRYPTLLANNLRMCVGLRSQYPWNVLHDLHENSWLSLENYGFFLVSLGLSLYIRTKTYIASKAQTEAVSLYSPSALSSGELYHVPQNLFIILGCLLVPIKRSLNSRLQQCLYLLNDGADMNQLIGSMIKDIVIDKEDFMLKVQLHCFVEDFDKALRELNKGVGGSIENVTCARFLELIQMKYRTQKSNDLEYKYVELCSAVLYSGKMYSVAIEYYIWLASYAKSSRSIAQWKYTTAECMLELNHLKASKTLVAQALILYKKVLGLEIDQDILGYLKHLIRSQKDISKTIIDIYSDAVKCYVLRADICMDKQKCQYKNAIKSLNYSLSINSLLLSATLANEFAGEYIRQPILQYIQSLDIFKSSQTLRVQLCNISVNFNRLCLVYEEIGHLDTSLDYAIKALNIDIFLFGADTNHSDIAYDMYSIATIYSKSGDLKKSLDYFNSSLEMSVSLHGEGVSHLDVAKTYNAIGVVYNTMGNYRTALEYYMKSLNVRKTLYGEDAKDNGIASTYNNIGTVYDIIGDYPTALAYHSKSLKMREAIYGAETNHADIAISYNNIGSVYNGICNYRAALDYYMRALEMRKMLYGAEANHLEIANSCSNIGSVYSKMEDFPTAYNYYINSLSIRRSVFGPDATCYDIANNFKCLANVCNGMAKNNIAVKYYNQALEMFQTIYGVGSNHSNIITCLIGAARVHQSAGNYTASLNYYEEAVLKLETSIDEVNHRIADVCSNIANAYSATDEYRKALEFYFKALELRKAMPPSQSNRMQIALAYSGIADIYSLAGQTTSMSVCYSQALVISANSFQSAGTVEIIGRLSDTLMKNSFYRTAFQFLGIALQRSDQWFNLKVDILHRIGRCSIHLKRWKNAWHCLYLALGGYQSLPDCKSSDLASVHVSISMLLLHLGHISQSLEHSRHALCIANNLVADRESTTPERCKLWQKANVFTESLHLVKICQQQFLTFDF